MGGFFLFDKVLKLVGGGSVINGAYPVQLPAMLNFGLFTEHNPYQEAFVNQDVRRLAVRAMIRVFREDLFSFGVMKFIP